MKSLKAVNDQLEDLSHHLFFGNDHHHYSTGISNLAILIADQEDK